MMLIESTPRKFPEWKGPSRCLLAVPADFGLDCQKGDLFFLLACVIQGVPPRPFPPCAENRVPNTH